MRCTLVALVAAACAVLLATGSAAAEEEPIYENWLFAIYVDRCNHEILEPGFGELITEDGTTVVEKGTTTVIIDIRNKSNDSTLKIKGWARLFRTPKPPGFTDDESEPEPPHQLGPGQRDYWADYIGPDRLNNAPGNTFHIEDNGPYCTELFSKHHIGLLGEGTWPWQFSCNPVYPFGHEPHLPYNDGEGNPHWHDWFVNIPAP